MHWFGQTSDMRRSPNFAGSYTVPEGVTRAGKSGDFGDKLYKNRSP
jgi:hypothetical protein